jgi:ABC-type thiamine transport system substrate-binding protein
MKQETAVQWLIEKFNIYLPSIHQKGLEENFKQALAIEKEQILDAYRHGRTDEKSGIEKWHNRTALKYFNDTYTETL